MNLRGRIGVPHVQHLRTPRAGEAGTRCPAKRFMDAMRENVFRRHLSPSDRAREKGVVSHLPASKSEPIIDRQKHSLPMDRSIRTPTGLGVRRWSLRNRGFGARQSRTRLRAAERSWKCGPQSGDCADSVTALQDAGAVSHTPIRFIGSMREVLFRRGLSPLASLDGERGSFNCVLALKP